MEQRPELPLSGKGMYSGFGIRPFLFVPCYDDRGSVVPSCASTHLFRIADYSTMAVSCTVALKVAGMTK